jgi:hypothetical protein
LNYIKTNKDLADKILLEIGSSICGFIKFFEMSKNLKDKIVPLNRKTFREFFELKLKRLPATEMIFSDLAFSEVPINEECLKCLTEMGRVLEYKITALRDFRRNQVN